MTRQEIKILNLVLSEIINRQKDISQPIYVIASYWCGVFEGIETIVTCDGNNDYAEIEKIFQEQYAWKEGMVGVTEQTYKLVRIDLKEVIDCFGRKVEELLPNDEEKI